MGIPNFKKFEQPKYVFKLVSMFTLVWFALDILPPKEKVTQIEISKACHD
jgi:hypothetical protein